MTTDDATCASDADQRWMRHALALAARAEREDDEVPVGALIVDADGQLLAEGWNRNICDHDSSAHAEIVEMRQAGMRPRNHRLLGCTLYVTLEPCALCAMEKFHADVARVGYGSSKAQTGAPGRWFARLAGPRHK